MIQRLPPSRIVAKPWGSTQLEPWFQNSSEKTGEVWFEGSGEFPLLLKFLFTTEKLSVQVHPDDAYALARYGTAQSVTGTSERMDHLRGKTEMWHVLRADPGAKVAIGLREPITPERLRQASESGEIEQLLAWREARPGDTFFIRPGTIHAIGAGLTLCEIQQLSDVTYRLYDYGRPRELHLDDGIKVSHLRPCNALQIPQPQSDGGELLVKCPFFTTQRYQVSGSWNCPLSEQERRLIVIEGHGEIAGHPTKAGDVWRFPGGEEAVVASGQFTLLITH